MLAWHESVLGRPDHEHRPVEGAESLTPGQQDLALRRRGRELGEVPANRPVPGGGAEPVVHHLVRDATQTQSAVAVLAVADGPDTHQLQETPDASWQAGPQR